MVTWKREIAVTVERVNLDIASVGHSDRLDVSDEEKGGGDVDHQVSC